MLFWESSQGTALQPLPGGLLGGVVPPWSYFTLFQTCLFLCTCVHTPLVCAYLLEVPECESFYALLCDTHSPLHT